MCDNQWLMLIGLQISGWRTIQNWPRRQKREPVVTLPVTMETYLLLAPASLQTEVCLMWRKTSTGRGVHFNTQLLIKIQQALLKIQLCFILNPTDTQLFLFFFFFLQKNTSQHSIQFDRSSSNSPHVWVDLRFNETGGEKNLQFSFFKNSTINLNIRFRSNCQFSCFIAINRKYFDIFTWHSVSCQIKLISICCHSKIEFKIKASRW